MPSKSKAKGNRLERLIVDTFEHAGFECERAYGSNGTALGEAPTVDNVAYIHGHKICIQAKSRKHIADFMKPPVGADVTILKEDRGEMMIVMPVTYFLHLIREVSQSPETQFQPDDQPQDSYPKSFQTEI